jgi:WD40 repeat protein
MYSKSKADQSKLSVQLMMHLNSDRIASINSQFEQRGGSVDMLDFVRIMQAHLPEYLDSDPRPETEYFGGCCGPERLERDKDLTTKGPPPKGGEVDESTLVANLCELFKEIDINGDGNMEWEEFTGFVVEKAAVFKDVHKSMDVLSDYHYKPMALDRNDRHRHNQYIEKLHYIEPYDQIAAIEQHSSEVTLYDASTGTHAASLTGLRGVPMALKYVEPLDCLVTACADMTMVAWNLGNANDRGSNYDGGSLPNIVKTYKGGGSSSFINSSGGSNRRFRNGSGGVNMEPYSVRSSWPTQHAQMSLCWEQRHQLLYSGSTAGMVHAWSVGKREEVTCLGKEKWIGHNDIVMDLMSMPELDNIVSASLDTKICLWDAYNGSCRQELKGHKKGVFSLSHNPDYRLLISGGFDHDALVWSPFVPTLLFKLKGHSASLVNVHCVPDTPEVVTADINGYFKLWDLRNFQCVQTFSDDGRGGLSGMTHFAHCGPKRNRFVASTKCIHFIDQGNSVREPVSHDLPISCVCYNNTNLSILTTTGQTVKIWDAITGNIRNIYRGIMTSDITAVCLDDRERKFIAGDANGHIRVFNYANGAMMKQLQSHTKEVSQLVYCGEHKVVLSCSWDKTTIVHDEMDPEKGTVLRSMDQMQQHKSDIISCAFSKETQLIATGSLDKSVRVWDYETGKLDGVMWHDAPISVIEFVHGYPLLVTADQSGVIKMWGVRLSPYKYQCCASFQHVCQGPIINLAEIAAQKEREEEQARLEVAKVVSRNTEIDELVGEIRAAEVESPTKKNSESKKSVLVPPLTDAHKRRRSLIYNRAPIKQSGRGAKGSVRAKFPIGPYSSKEGAASVVMTLAWIEDKTMLVTGDDNGVLQCWNFRPIIDILRLKPITAQKRRVPGFARRGSISQYCPLDSPPHPLPQPKWMYAIQAHSDTVARVLYVPSSGAIITGAFDRCVSLWNMEDGEWLGTLLQGLEKDVKNLDWDFPVDIQDRKSNEAKETEAVTTNLWDEEILKKSQPKLDSPTKDAKDTFKAGQLKSIKDLSSEPGDSSNSRIKSSKIPISELLNMDRSSLRRLSNFGMLVGPSGGHSPGGANGPPSPTSRFPKNGASATEDKHQRVMSALYDVNNMKRSHILDQNPHLHKQPSRIGTENSLGGRMHMQSHSMSTPQLGKGGRAQIERLEEDFPQEATKLDDDDVPSQFSDKTRAALERLSKTLADWDPESNI